MKSDFEFLEEYYKIIFHCSEFKQVFITGIDKRLLFESEVLIN